MDERYINSGGAQLWTSSQGRGVPTLLCNGGPGCCDYLAPVAAMIDDIAQVIRWEPRGCGRSSETPPYDAETCVADLEAIRQSYGIERWIVGGHSWGPNVALAYALAYPERVLGLIAISGGKICDDRSWNEEYHRREEEEGELQPEFAYPHNMNVNREGSATWRAYIRRPALLREISRLTTPSLCVYGENDIRPAWPTEQLANLLPRGEFVLIPGAGHVIWATHPEELRHTLRQFVTTLSLREQTQNLQTENRKVKSI